jgi:hypothetical protein
VILNDVIVEVRRLIQDETTTYRLSDAFMLGLCNQVLQRVQLIRPDLFAYFGTLTCVQGEVLQTAPADSLRIIEIHGIVGGNRLIEVNRLTLDQTAPGWANDTEAAAVNWMRHIRNGNKFFIYPQAPAAQVLDIEYSQVPTTYDGTTAVTLLPDAFFPTVIDGVVWLAESIDNENVIGERAKMYKDSFMESLGATSLGRPALVTDTEIAGQPRTGQSGAVEFV